MLVYDRGESHFSSELFPADLSPSAAFVRAGMFVAWLAERDLLELSWVYESGGLVAQCRQRNLTGAKLLAQAADGTFDERMLNPEGNAFTQYYFDLNRGKYRDDYKQLLAAGLPSLYHVRDSWSNYDRIRERIDERYKEWKKRRR